MTIPAVDRAALLAALARFDQELRGQGRFARWPTAADTCAITHGGCFYPPKIIISLATGAGVHTFSGGAASTRYTNARGLITVPIGAALRAALHAAPPPASQEERS